MCDIRRFLAPSPGYAFRDGTIGNAFGEPPKATRQRHVVPIIAAVRFDFVCRFLSRKQRMGCYPVRFW